MRGTHTIRPFVRLSLTLIMLLISTSATLVQAQEPAVETEGAPARMESVAPTKSYVFEGIIFSALAGAAIYAVCRSSPRGL